MTAELEKINKQEKYTNHEKEEPLEDLENVTERTIKNIKEETAMSLKLNTELGNNFSENNEISEVINNSKSEILQNEDKSQKSILEKIRNNPKLRTLFYSLILTTGLSFASEKAEAQFDNKPKTEQTHEKEITQEKAKESLKEVITKLYNINKAGGKILEGSDDDKGMPGYYFGNFTLSHPDSKGKLVDEFGKPFTDRMYEVEFNRTAETGELKNASISFHDENNSSISLSFNEWFNGNIEYLGISLKEVEGYKKMSVREFEDSTKQVMASVKGDKNTTPIWVNDKFDAKEIQSIISDFNENFKNYTPDGKPAEKK